MKCIRVFTKTQPITTSRKHAEKEMNVRVMGLNAMRQGAKYAQEGDYMKARLHTYSTARTIGRNITVENQREVSTWIDAVENMDSQIRTAQTSEILPEPLNEEEVKQRSEERRTERSTNDRFASTLWQMNSSPNNIWKPN